jgi:ATP-dependent Lon protease
MNMPDENEPIEGEVMQPIGSSELALAEQVLPDTLYLLPLSERPFFPAQTLPLLMNMGPWLDTVEKIGETAQKLVGLVLVRPNSVDDASHQDFYNIGTVIHMHHPVRSEGKIQFIAEGQKRFRIIKWLSREAPYRVQVEYLSDSRGANSDEVKAYAMAIINSIKELLPLNPLYSEELKFFLNRFSPNEPSLLTDFAASLTTAPKEKLQDVLEALNLRRRMEKVLVLIKKELDVARLQSQIREQVDEKMTKQQREFFLREQLKAIQIGRASCRERVSIDV